MTWLDLVLLLLLALSAFGGYRRGALLQIVGLAGMAVGLTLAVLVAPRVARLSDDPTSQVALALAVIVVGAAAGNLAGWLAGTRLRSHPRAQRMRRADATGGILVSVAALLITTWFLALNLADGPFPQVARGIRGSVLVRGLDAALPAPPSITGDLQRLMGTLGFPDVFAGLPPLPAAPVDPPDDAQAAAAVGAATPSTVEVLGRGCFVGFLNQGSGVVVAPGYVVTNAHVVAGTNEHWIVGVGRDHPAAVVALDPELDIAVLRVPTLDAPALELAADEVGRGAGGAVLGHVHGGPLEGVPAAVRAVIAPAGRDIYGRGVVSRRLYELQAEIARGNSGGPFVLPDGRVAGIVFAASVVADGIGYAVVSTEVIPALREAQRADAPVDTGACTGA